MRPCVKRGREEGRREGEEVKEKSKITDEFSNHFNIPDILIHIQDKTYLSFWRMIDGRESV